MLWELKCTEKVLSVYCIHVITEVKSLAAECLGRLKKM